MPCLDGQEKVGVVVVNVLLLFVSWAVAVFLANRLYVIIKYQAITIKGIT